MQGHNQMGKHQKPLPNARQIRRSCEKELYRTIKRLKVYIPPEQVKEAEALYTRKVMVRLLWIVENGSNRRLLADWFETDVAPELGELWQVEPGLIAEAFRDSFGG